MLGVGLTRRKSAVGNGSSNLLSDCLLQIRKLCGFLLLSLFPFFILPVSVCVPAFFGGNEYDRTNRRDSRR